jgi:SAM-dependent methyltransferase
MVDLARRRVGSRAEVFEADLGQGLAIAPGAFDVVVASLVMHYLRDWHAALSEVHRVLSPSGRFLFSTHHPTMDARLHSPDDYFAVKEVTEQWGDEGFPVTFWRRPLTDITDAITTSGFVITSLAEPRPEPALEKMNPSTFLRLCTQPAFLFFELRPRPSQWA